MLVFAAITPHPPIAIPSIGKENLRYVAKTTTAFHQLAEEIYASQPDTIIIISPHGTMLQNAFTLNVVPQFSVDFKEFGDLTTAFTVLGDTGFSHHIKEGVETQLPVVLASQERLDHGVGVPLYFLTENLNREKTRVIPISFSLLDLENHFKFGRALQDKILNDTRRVAVIASGDLSHRLSETSPAGFSPAGKKFDDAILSLLYDNKIKEILSFDRDIIEEAAECGLRSIVILLGILNSIRSEIQVLSYEAPFGVGYLTANFKIDN
ncbi:MAG: AmmeMemoRadiSam system protein B [Patescibacteria group bacterium]|jgi:AmmeMemoRadiSam system protein B